MNDSDWRSKVKEIVETKDLEMVEIKIEPRGKFDIIKLFVDKDDGVSIRDCSSLARLINDYLSEEQDYGKDYRLEVSSPGVDRPLTELKHFIRNLNRQVKVTFSDEGKQRTIEGTLITADEKVILIKQKKAESEIPLNSIEKAVIALPW
ncbi:ribosome maturation factor RimP [candidate division KSB1 bacterium]